MVRGKTRERIILDWLSRIDKDTKEARNKRIFDLWMACYTQDEIAKMEGCSVQPVKDVIADKTANLPENLKPYALHQVDFYVPLYNIWKQQEKIVWLRGVKSAGADGGDWSRNGLIF